MTDELSQLVQRAKEGDAKAFACLVERYGRPVERIARQILGEREEARDAAQEAWLVALQRLRTLEDPQCFPAWLYRVVSNTALQRRRQRMAGRAYAEMASRLASNDRPANADPDHAQATHFLPAAMMALSPMSRLILELHHFSGMGVNRLAGLFGMPAGSIKSRLHYARQQIGKEITTMAQESKRPPHQPVEFRQVIQDEIGDIPWQPLWKGTPEGWKSHRNDGTFGDVGAKHPAKEWEALKDGVIGTAESARTCLKTGDETWTDYELSLLVTALAGGNVQVVFRMGRQMEPCYVLDMMFGWQAVAVNKLESRRSPGPKLTRLSVVNFPLEHLREYALSIAVRGLSLTTYLDGALVNQVTDDTCPRGGVGLNVWHSKTLYRDLRVRHLR